MSKVEGIVVIYKEKGYTSHDVVNKVRSIVFEKKVGHTGTLDPDATGVLPVCIGNATKVVEYLTEKDKEYIATINFGIVTDTQDMSGKVIAQFDDFELDSSEVEKVINSFVGEYMQTPPIYSAVKVKGKKLYEYARSGETVKIPPRKVCIKEIEILEIGSKHAKIRIVCSKGTYIRALCHDIGKKLKVGAVMGELTRTKSGCFKLENAVTLDEFERIVRAKTLDAILLNEEVVFQDYEKLYVKKDSLKKLVNGNKLVQEDFEFDVNIEEKIYTVYYEDKFYALYKGVNENEKIVLKVEKMFVRGE